MELLFEFDLEYDEDSSFGLDPQKDLEYLLSEIDRIDNSIDKELVARAFAFCVEKHSDTARKSGYPYYTHPLNVALILLKEFSIHDTASIVASLLHDTIEDVADVGESQIALEFGTDVAEIVQAVTKISNDVISLENSSINWDELDGKQKAELKHKLKAGTHRKLFLALVRDIRVILIKLADRLHNLRTLHYLSPKKQKEISLETLNFYIPITHRLGLMKIKMELENRSFYYSDKSAYEAIRLALNEKRRDFIDYIKVFSDTIQNSLNQHNLTHTLSIVHKHEYEIFKMINDGKSISDIDNFYSMVLILDTNDIHECYRAHGVLATAFNTISFIDYIAKPKMDWFKSLVTELFGPDGKRIEIIIRTEEMEKIAEEGFASKFSLRSGRIRALNFTDKEIDDWGDWMQGIIEEKGERATQIIWDAIKVNLFDSELTVYTKDGKAITLPEGANLIDFAFSVSDDSGYHCISGKVNGVITDLNHKLKTGDQVEIIYSNKFQPRPEWQESVVSHKAVSMLHDYFKNHVASKVNEVAVEVIDFDAKIRIRGEDRERMLFEITEAIGKSIIKRISLDTSESFFEGIVAVKVKDKSELNAIITRLMGIKGIKSVIKVYD
ncbi:MAG: HD domain-containing protein [Candidatus Kapabacteria bacterium]|nr:HD domain-containing protein [Ignavibacteriota bacterium]MCW5884371.1 HD domain-containing protein [Candidatus Kapabacteria bacterium]